LQYKFTLINERLLLGSPFIKKLSLQYRPFKALLIAAASNVSSSPYFMRCYERLCEEYTYAGNRSSILLGLMRIQANSGYIMGESKLSRSLLTADIFYIFIPQDIRGAGYGKRLVEAFEIESKERSSAVGVNTISIRIVMKSCLRSSYDFWIKNGFVGDKKAEVLLKMLTIA
jgi:GNAT superfamily N-acetyltransferase